MAQAELHIEPIDANFSLKGKIYQALKQGITSMNLYAEDVQLRVDERQLSAQMGISRTPIREALARLEQEGLVRIVPRKGVYIVQKTKKQILEMITVWAALESMAARLIAQNATDDEIASLRGLFTTFDNGQLQTHIDEYSEANIRFHQAILEMSHCQLLVDSADNIFMHVGSIRARTISEDDRANRSITDHMHIIEALESRDAELASRLVREHALDLAKHVEMNVNYLG